MLKINAGSGQRPFGKGWINLDIQEKWREASERKGGVFECCDMEKMPYADGTCKLVVSHHTLEHMGCGEGAQFVKEAYRVLVPGGSFIVCVPDMYGLAKRYAAGQIDCFTFMVNCYGAYMGDEADRHKWGYSRNSLELFLVQHGLWKTIIRF